MTLPSSYPITLGQVCTEFGAPATTPLGSFLRGGSYVPNTAANSGVPTSKPITLGDLLGASATTPLAASATDVTGNLQTRPNESPPPTYLPTFTIATVGTSTCTASGGSGSYTYSWSVTGGFALVNATSATVTVRCGTARYAGTYTGTLTCVVNDGTTTKTVTASVTLTVTNP